MSLLLSLYLYFLRLKKYPNLLSVCLSLSLSLTHSVWLWLYIPLSISFHLVQVHCLLFAVPIAKMAANIKIALCLSFAFLFLYVCLFIPLSITLHLLQIQCYNCIFAICVAKVAANVKITLCLSFSLSLTHSVCLCLFIPLSIPLHLLQVHCNHCLLFALCVAKITASNG